MVVGYLSIYYVNFADFSVKSFYIKKVVFIVIVIVIVIVIGHGQYTVPRAGWNIDIAHDIDKSVLYNDPFVVTDFVTQLTLHYQSLYSALFI